MYYYYYYHNYYYYHWCSCCVCRLLLELSLLNNCINSKTCYPVNRLRKNNLKSYQSTILSLSHLFASLSLSLSLCPLCRYFSSLTISPSLSTGIWIVRLHLSLSLSFSLSLISLSFSLSLSLSFSLSLSLARGRLSPLCQSLSTGLGLRRLHHLVKEKDLNADVSWE